MATHWFCKIMGDEQGPMTAGQLQAIARSGGLGIDDLVRKNGQSMWVRAENVIGLFDQPSLPVVVHESIAVIDDFAPVRATWEATAALSAANGQKCSIEVRSSTVSSGNSSSSHSIGNSTARSGTTNERDRHAGSRASSVIVPRRTLKVAATASVAAVAQKFSNRTTQAAGFNSQADTLPTVGAVRTEQVVRRVGVTADQRELVEQGV